MQTSKTLGSALLITGTAIGAGMLGIPLATSSLGFLPTLCLLVLIWGFSYLAALILLEITLGVKGDNLHLNSMARQTLGRQGQFIAGLCVLGLLFSLTVAYIAGGSSILHAMLAQQLSTPPPQWLLSCLFTVVLGTFIFISHRATDLLNRGLFSFKTILLIVMLALCLPVVDVQKLMQTPVESTLFLSAAPVIFVSFGFHHIVPSLAQYNDNHIRTLKRIILIGSVLPLFIYILWLVMTLGILPVEGSVSFASLPAGDVGAFIVSLSTMLQKPWLIAIVNAFANIALITSFLGVTLGLFDFLCDIFNVETQRWSSRGLMAGLTFGIPLVFAIAHPSGFIRLLAYGGVFLAVMAFILPPLMLIKLRMENSNLLYRAPGGWLVPLAVLIFGVMIAVLGVVY